MVVSPKQTAIPTFDRKMYQACLAYYGLPPNWNRVFKSLPRTDRETGKPLYKTDGTPETMLAVCNPATESLKGNAVWIQVNKPRPDTALTQKGNPKKAKNEDIGMIANLTLDFEYPQEPGRAHRVGMSLVNYLIQSGIAHEGQPIEDSGGGPHIVLPLPVIETTQDTAELWNEAVRAVVKKYIQPEFERLVQQAGIKMDLGGFDISRVLSTPGTWRPTNPNKPDCEQLKQGYLRGWLPPYTNGHYPVRKESAKLAEMIRAEYIDLQELSKQELSTNEVSLSEEARTDASEWLTAYAAQHPNSDRSALFQSLVNATYLKYDAETVIALKEKINQLAGAKYDGRLDDALKLSLEKAKQIPKLRSIVIGRQLREMTKDALDTLSEVERGNPSLFIQAGRIVRIGRNELGRPAIQAISDASLRGKLTRSANYYRLKEKDKSLIPMSVAPPQDIVDDILGLEPQALPFPSVQGVVEAPSLRPDFSILDKPGYDPATHLYYLPRLGLGSCAVPHKPSNEDIQHALSIIWEALGEFPYVDKPDFANGVGALATPLYRAAISSCVPLCIFDAPKQGAGKGLHVNVISTIATGDKIAVLTPADSEEEWDKRITTLLLEGASLIGIDNIPSRLHSAKLDAALTAEIWKARILGQSKTITVVQRATWLATGNNVKLGGDLARRCYRVRLDPQVSRPWEVTGFTHPDLDIWVADHRAELIVALLTLARAWDMDGRPQAKTRELASFTPWARLIGNILANVGIYGFLDNLSQLYDEADDEAVEWEAFLKSWEQVFEDAWISTSDIIDHLDKADVADSSNQLSAKLIVPDALETSRREKTGNFSIRLGRALEKRVETCFGEDNLRIERSVDSHTKAKSWRVVRIVRIVNATLRREKNFGFKDTKYIYQNAGRGSIDKLSALSASKNGHVTPDGSTSGVNGNLPASDTAKTLSANTQLSANPDGIQENAVSQSVQRSPGSSDIGCQVCGAMMAGYIDGRRLCSTHYDEVKRYEDARRKAGLP